MYHNSRVANPQRHYQILELSSKLESADPHGLVSILYDELLRSLDVVAAALKQGRDISYERQSERAKSILLALSASLNFENGNSVADVLDGVYRAMLTQLTQAITDGSAEKLADLRAGKVEVSAAWQSIKFGSH